MMKKPETKVRMTRLRVFVVGGTKLASPPAQACDGRRHYANRVLREASDARVKRDAGSKWHTLLATSDQSKP